MPIKVLHFSTHDEACGIGKYQEMFLQAMEENDTVENVFFEVSPSGLRSMTPEEREDVYVLLRKRLQYFDILHLQHEFSIFVDDTLPRACQIAKEMGKKVVVTIHTGIATIFTRVPFVIKTPRDIGRYVKRSLRMRAAIRTVLWNLVEPLKTADLILVHNEKAKADLVARGVPAAKFAKIVIPVPLVDRSTSSDTIGIHLRREPGDVIVGIVGFINKLKGTGDAVEALALLPKNYKLAIIGGLHPRGSPPYGDAAFLDGLLHQIKTLDLGERIHITGYIEDDERLNALVRECDLCVFPYDKIQYGNSSSAALNNAFANHRPVVTYPTGPFKEINGLGGRYLEIADDFTPREIARAIRKVDLSNAEELSKEFSERYSYPVVAGSLAGLYVSLLDKR